MVYCPLEPTDQTQAMSERLVQIAWGLLANAGTQGLFGRPIASISIAKLEKRVPLVNFTVGNHPNPSLTNAR